MGGLLYRIESPADLHHLSDKELDQLAQEMRDEMIRVLRLRPAHFASNLGVVELCLALHLTFDFRKDRLIWDTGHQVYPHKLLTGRARQFHTIRTRGGLMGYPNPHESDYDLFMTGHAGCSISCGLGLKTGDDLQGHPERHTVVVIGDGALPSGIVYEAMNNAGGLNKNVLIILNDNKMSICPRVGGLAQALDRARLAPLYQDAKEWMHSFLSHLPIVGNLAHQAFDQVRDALKALLTGGMLFEELGLRYFGPVDGHDLPSLRRWLSDLKTQKGPILLHVFTEKGHGVPQASQDPVTFHTPPPFAEVGPDRTIVSFRKSSSPAYTDAVSQAIYQLMREDRRVVAITAAMCQGNKLERVRADFPDRFFDTGICEAHAVAFAAGLAKSGMRPIAAIYSTFLQRAFDQLFQEVSLQNLPVVFCLDRAGLTGPDGPTHHGVFDIVYLRLFPHFIVMAPGDALDILPMLRFALAQAAPTALRYPKAALERVERTPSAIELGRAEVYRWGRDGGFVAYGHVFPWCVRAAELLRQEAGLDLTVINARFVKPLDSDTILQAVHQLPWIITVEEGTLEGGFGSAVLEAANRAGVDTRRICRLGLPDRYIEHGEREELLRDLRLDVEGLCHTVRELAARWPAPRAGAGHPPNLPLAGRRAAVEPVQHHRPRA